MRKLFLLFIFGCFVGALADVGTYKKSLPVDGSTVSDKKYSSEESPIIDLRDLVKIPTINGIPIKKKATTLDEEAPLYTVLLSMGTAIDLCSDPRLKDKTIIYTGLRTGWTVHLLRAFHAVKGSMKFTGEAASAATLTAFMAPAFLLSADTLKKFGIRASLSSADLIIWVKKHFQSLVKEEIRQADLITRTSKCSNFFGEFCTKDCQSCKKDQGLLEACLYWCKSNKSIQSKCALSR